MSSPQASGRRDTPIFTAHEGKDLPGAPSLSERQRLFCTLCDGNGHRCDYCDGDGFVLAEDMAEHAYEPRMEIFHVG